VGNGDRTFSKFSPEHTLVDCSSLEVTHKGLEKDCLPEPENDTQHTIPFTTFRVPSTVLRYGVLVFLVS